MSHQIDITFPLHTTYFASGSNHAGEILGFVDAGINPGATVCELRSGAEQALAALRGSGVKVFLDSGAFGEVGFGPSGPFVKRPITAEEWAARLDTYDRLAADLGGQLYVVAPDRVAFQADTLGLLGRYADRVRALAATGAHVLVPHQKGALSLSEFNARATEILGCDFIPAIPMKKDATSTAELVEFLEAVRPAAVHLLGLGESLPRFGEVEAACRAVLPTLELLCDSVAITAKVGRTGGAGGGARPLTLAQDKARLEMEAALFADGVDGLDYTEAAICPSTWLTMGGRRELARLIGLEGAERRALVADVDGWLQEGDRYLWPHVEGAVDELWRRYADRASTTWRKRTAIRKVFSN